MHPKNNETLTQLQQQDQADRTYYHANKLTEKQLFVNDRKRLKAVFEMLENNELQTSDDYKNAAIILHHGRTIEDERHLQASDMAIELMRKSIKLEPNRGKWLLAAIIDRNLMIKGKPQIYGTQYIRKHKSTPWEFYKIDPTQITDKERKVHNVETLEEQKVTLIRMNKRQLISLYQNNENLDKILEICKNEKLQTSTYDVSWKGIDLFGYQLFRANEFEQALKIFQLNINLNPLIADIHHSLGECWQRLGNEKLAVKAYLKAIEINPNFDIAINDLKHLQKQISDRSKLG